MADYLTTDTELTSIADAIRTKGGTSASLVYPAEFIAAINAIPTGGSLEMESGIYTMTSDEARPTISFSNTHTLPPSFAYAVYNGFPGQTASNQAFILLDLEAISGYPMYYNGSNTRPAMYYAYYRGTGTAGAGTAGVITNGRTDTGAGSTSYYRYFATPTELRPYGGSGSRYWRSGYSLKWAAYWL